jgi:hypothetical protein
MRVFSDSTLARAGEKDGPVGRISQEWLIPTASDAGLKSFLETAIAQAMVGDSIAAVHKTPEAIYKTMKNDAFADYAIEWKEWDPKDADLSPIMFMRESSTISSVYHVDDKLLTIGTTYYNYSGGAHGNHATSLHSFDLVNRKTLNKDDIFTTDAEKIVLPAIEKAARKRFGLDAKAPLSNVLFENNIPMTDNIGLTPKGVLFSYAPYEIAAYAYGQVELFVPFSELKGALKNR